MLLRSLTEISAAVSVTSRTLKEGLQNYEQIIIGEIQS